MLRFSGAVSAAVLAAATAIAFAQDQKAREQDADQAVRRLLTQMEDAFNQGDAKRLGACWAAGGDFVRATGQRVEGRDNIEKGFLEFLAAQKDRTLHLQVLSLRIAGDAVALVDVLPVMKSPAGTVTGEYSLDLVLVKRDDRWLIESARQTVLHAPSSARHLKDIEWLAGRWADDVSPQDGISFQSSCDWTANRNFLIRKFEVAAKDGLLHGGTEIIGWDPRARRIRSWVFDSNGGFGENAWIRDGNRWLLRYSGTLADGSDISATHILTLTDPNTLTLQSKDRTVNGEPQPEIPETTIRRQAAAAGAAGKEESPKPPQRVLP